MRIHCPICKTPTTWEENPWRPFCSERCKSIDLGRWASEEYRVPGPPLNEKEKDDARAAGEDADGEDGGD